MRLRSAGFESSGGKVMPQNLEEGMIHEFNRLDIVQVSEQRFARNLDLQFVWQFVAHEGGTRLP